MQVYFKKTFLIIIFYYYINFILGRFQKTTLLEDNNIERSVFFEDYSSITVDDESVTARVSKKNGFKYQKLIENNQLTSKKLPTSYWLTVQFTVTERTAHQNGLFVQALEKELMLENQLRVANQMYQ